MNNNSMECFIKFDIYIIIFIDMNIIEKSNLNPIEKY